jgi:hypothetical protein
VLEFDPTKDIYTKELLALIAVAVTYTVEESVETIEPPIEYENPEKVNEEIVNVSRLKKSPSAVMSQ